MNSSTHVSTPGPSSRRLSRSAAKASSPVFDLPRLPPAPPTPGKFSRYPSLPPKLGIKKRKPRAHSVISAANNRALDHVPRDPAPAPSHSVHHPQPRRKSKHAEQEVKRKGLRHFAVRVSRKVEQKGVTTYNEVADELVAEELALRRMELEDGGEAALDLQKRLEKGGGLVDEKNIRRRVYDSLNVLMAMGIIQKEKKLISWQGLAVAACNRGNAEVDTLKVAIAERKSAVMDKTRALTTVQDQFEKTAALVERNKLHVDVQDILNDGRPSIPVHHHYQDRIGLPFVVITAHKDTFIELEMNEAREEICFTLNASFNIYDEREILRRMPLPTPALPASHDAPDFEQFSKELLSITQPENH